MKRNKVGSRLLAAMLSMALTVGWAPVSAWAAPAEEKPANATDVTANVEYLAKDRTQASIRYHKEGEAATEYNLLFLLDVSTTGERAAKSFLRMMEETGAGTLFEDADAMQGSLARVVAYRLNSTQVSEDLTSQYDLLGQFKKLTNVGEGANGESEGLEKAVEAVQAMKKAHPDRPTVVYWVLGNAPATPEDKLRPLLDQLTQQLGSDGDILMTWQLGVAEPNQLLQEYATRYTTQQPGEDGSRSAARAAEQPISFQSEMAAALQALAHDRYHDLSMTLSLDPNQTLVTGISDVQVQTGSQRAQVSGVISPDGKEVQVQIDQMDRHLDLDLTLNVQLDPNCHERQTVLSAATVSLEPTQEGGGLDTGAFDEQTQSTLSWRLPQVELDRREYTITYVTEQGTISPVTRMPGEWVVLSDGAGLSKEGESFSGWNTTSREDKETHYQPGQVIAMPEHNLTLTPAWGHAVVELEIAEAKPAEKPSNQMGSDITLLDFSKVTIDSQPVGVDGVNKVVVKDETLEYNTDPGTDTNKVTVSDRKDIRYARHIGATEHDRVVAYLTGDSKPYTMVLAAPGGVKASADSLIGLFGISSGWSSHLKEIDLTGLDTSAATSMKLMFNGCTALQNVTFGPKFDTSQVTDFDSMFNSCSALTTLDISRFDTSAATTMVAMFSGCKGLTQLTFGTNFSTANVTNMQEMFSGCTALTGLNVSGFDTQKVVDMQSMFSECRGLTELDVSSFNTTSATNLQSMFLNCSGLTRLTLGTGFTAEKATNLYQMFSGCNSLTELDLSAFRAGLATDMGYMLSDCRALSKLNLSEFQTQSVTNMEGMFSECRALTELTLGNGFDTGNVTNMKAMFSNCQALKTLNLGEDFNTAKVQYMNGMFYSCQSLTNLNLGEGFQVSQVKQFYSAVYKGMFENCYALQTIEGALQFGADNAAETMQNMFLNCREMDNVPLEFPGTGAQFNHLTSLEGMFKGCEALTEVTLGPWTVPGLSNLNNLFYDCKAIQNIVLHWYGMGAHLDSLKLENIFFNVPKQAKLTLEGTEAAPGFFDQIKKRFPGTVDRKDESAPKEEAGLDQPPVPAPEESQPAQDDTAAVPPEASQDGNDADPTSPTTLPLLARSGQPMLMTAAAGPEATEEPASVVQYEKETPPGSDVTFLVRVRYDGALGATSGIIHVKMPLPDFVVQHATETDITVSDVVQTDPANPYTGGRVVGTPKIQDGALTAVVEDLCAGCQLEISFTCTLQDQGDYNPDGYMFWDATAYAQEDTGNVASNTVRLWSKEEESTPPPPNRYQVSYQFAGDVPPDVELPAAAVYAAEDTVTLPEQDDTGAYQWKGWHTADVALVGDSFQMPDKDVTLIGTWERLPQADEKITVTYQYEGKAPPQAPDIPEAQTVAVGNTYYIVPAPEDVSTYKFGYEDAGTYFHNWKPQLTIAGQPITLITRDGGKTFVSEDERYTIDLETGKMETDAFKGQQNVAVTFTGAWIPYRGTIHFDGNGASGSMEDMTQVACDSQTPLTANKFTFEFTQSPRIFAGWALSPVGEVVKQDGAPADGLIQQDGEVVTLYARWTVDTYQVEYDLEHVTAQENDTDADRGERYFNKLTPDAGHYLDEVSIQMAGEDITEEVYDAASGEITIPKVTGDIILQAAATEQSQPGEGSGGGSVTRYPIYVEVQGNGAAHADRDRASVNQTVTVQTQGTVKRIEAQAQRGGTISLTQTGPDCYTFKMPASAVTVTVEFEPKHPTVTVTDPNETGVSSWLNTQDHSAYVVGYPSGEFGPEDQITRGEVAQIFYRLLLDKTVESTKEFSDVPSDAWYHEAVVTLAARGILLGYVDGTARPDQPITRAEFCMIAARFAKAAHTQTLPFSDVEEGSWYAAAVETAVAYGWVSGCDDGTFRPYRQITRGEATAILNRMLARISDYEAVDQGHATKFPDVLQGYWAFYDIAEAATTHDYTRPNPTAQEQWKL